MTDPKSSSPDVSTSSEDSLPTPLHGASRREFLATATVLTVGGSLLLEGCQHTPAAADAPGTTPPPAMAPAAGDTEVTFTLNGDKRTVKVDPRTTLLDALRHHLGLTGTKKGCDHGQCGACTVLIDGKRINSCLKLAVTLDGAEITTIEGLGQPGDLHPLQSAFCDHDAFQCGYCTPGQICSAQGLINEGKAKTREEVRELMSGNLCRCGAYSNIVDAVLDVIGEKA